MAIFYNTACIVTPDPKRVSSITQGAVMYSTMQKREAAVAIRDNEEVDDPGVARRPGRPRNADNDIAILEAATAILFEKGYAGLTIDGVASAAGVSRPTIYRRWASKPELVIAALAHRTGVAIPVPNTGSVRRDLMAVQRHQIREFNNPVARRVTLGARSRCGH